MDVDDERCLNPNRTLGMDEACLSIVNEQNAPVRIFSYVNECGACDGTLFANLSANSNTTLVIPTRYKMHMYYKYDKYEQCHQSYKFVEHGHYGWNVSDNGHCSWYYTLREPLDPYIPIWAGFTIFVIIFTFWLMFDLLKHYVRKLKARRANENGDMETLQDSESTPPPIINVSRFSTRIHAIDAFRGIAVLLMIFVNNHGGGYVFFNHSPWYGLTIADLVLPWFAWIMGFTLVVSLRTQLRISVSRWRFVLQALRRSLCLIFLGLLINSIHPTTLSNLRFPGVLQLLGISYFICAVVEAIFMKAQRNFQYGRFMFVQDILECWPQWLIMIGIGVTHALITFLLHVPGCPTGYLGPGGYQSRGQYANCTGGAAGYIDRLVFGNHTYSKTDNEIYGQTLRHDPEGIMNTLSAVIIVALGARAGTILLFYLFAHSKILRWFSWAAVTGLAAGFLCNWTKDDGLVPISKNMMTISFVLVTSSLAFILFALLFCLIDHKRIWSGAPFTYAGMNPIFLYVGHYLTMKHFPWSWKIIDPTHADLYFMNLWTTVLWGFIAYLLYKKNIIITI